MGAAFKLSDAIDESIISKLKTIGQEAETTAGSYAKLVLKMNEMQKNNPNSLVELEAKTVQYNEAVKQLHATQSKLSELQKKQKEIYAQVAKEIKAQIEHKERELKIEAERVATKKQDLKNLKEEQNQQKKRKVTIEEATKALNTEAKTMAEVAEQNRVLRKAMQGVDFTTEEGLKTLETYNKKLAENDALLDKHSDAMTQRKRNIGNYASAWNGLGMSVQQLARELPSLSMGFNTFFLAISNNLPMLADEIKRARMEFQAMKAAGEKATPVWMQLGKAIISWQTALVVGITVLSMYGKEIMEWGKSLFQGKEDAEDLVSAQNKINDSIKESGTSVGEQIAKIKQLSSKWKDLGGDLNSQKKFIVDNKDAFNDLGVQVTTVKDAENLLVTNTDAFILAMTQRAQAAAGLKLASEQYEKAMKKQIEIDKAIEEGPSFGDKFQAFVFTVGGSSGTREQAEKREFKERIESMKKEKEEIEKLAFSYITLSTTKDEDSKATLDSANIKLIESSKKLKEEQDAERKRIEMEKALIDSRIELIEDEKERELAENERTFAEKLAQIKGNSDKELELRENLIKLRSQKEIEIENKYTEKKNKEIQEQEKKTLQERMDNIDKNAEINAINLATAQITENQELEDAYKQGLIDREEYEREKFELQKHYNEMALRNAIETAKLMVEMMPDGADKDKAMAKLRQQMAELKVLMSTEFEDNKSGDDWASKKWQDKWSESIEYVSEAMNGVVDIIGSSFDAQIQKIEEEQEANEEAGQKELERIQELADKGVITEEEAEARKRAAEEKTAKKNEELEKKKAALQTKQAKMEKAANIASVIMNTAVAIMKAWGQTGIFGAPMAALIGAMGAIQLATVIAQPIPKYAKGTKSHKGGLAVVGDGGVSETVITDKGIYVTPDTPTLVDLPKGAQVIPFVIDMDMMKAKASDVDGLMAYRKENELPPITIENDYSGLERKLERLEKSQKQGFATLARAIKNQDYKRFAASI